MPQPVRVGTRASQLALTQTGHVADALTRLGAGPHELVRVRTDGDRLTGSLTSLGGTGVFVTALRDALLDGRCDVAVHSFKDLPTADADGLVVAAVPPREDPRDALCARDGLTLATLPVGASVGTGSPRRAAQLLAARPDLRVVDIRGNVDTRLARALGEAADLDAVVLARAGLARLGRLDAITDTLPTDVMTPAPAQGALAVEVRAEVIGSGSPLALALAALDDQGTRLAVLAERALLARLEAGCAAPVGAYGHLAEGTLTLSTVVLRPDGTERLLLDGSTPLTGDPVADAAEATALGERLAADLLADGAADLAGLGGPGA
ncbi:hydroxymethylbilane synthase [Cellulomonas denverensis]|uniref:Porphobilinogen deaminase n=1 Tax=Cellulomonas denverensis TaxID=264297 RepID=A0A7X6R0X3_9CELL|nr:hydroxymethylbilane synthase [Cellulomonas denverensis]NKY24581.1 hydroxymethylbilane synthase [Cellulomonas denverensis]GIG27066.1 porphobilinogen deaminase [Cellulomonas denverensis]